MNRHHNAARLFLCLVGELPPRPTVRLLAVPFVRHAAETAIPAALSMVLGFYGTRLSTRRIADDAGMEPWSSRVDPQMLAEVAHSYGFNAQVVCGGISRLAGWLDQGIPPLVFSTQEGAGADEPVVVVTGISPSGDAVRVHYGSTPHRWLRAAEFMELCGGEAFTALVVSAKTRPVCSKVRVPPRSFWNIFPSSASAWDTVHAVAA